MLHQETKRKIDNARDILVGKIPVPMSQIEQITLALTYKFMSDIDEENKELGGASFFEGDYEKYSWKNLMDKKLGAQERMNLYSEGLESMSKNKNIPELFRDIFRGAYLPFKDPQTLDRFLKQINEFSYDHSEELGNAFEYLLSTAGSQGDAGQFRTPRHIIDFLVSVVEPTKEDTILDPACGTAGFLISAYKFILSQNINKDGKIDNKIELTKKLSKNITGYDISHDMVRLSLVNMYLHSFANPKIYEYDTLSSEDRWNDDFDCILANPPFMTPKGGIQPHSKFSIRASKSEVLFVDYIMEHLTINGKAGIIVPEGIIFQSANAYKDLRKKMIEQNYLWAVVSLPSGIFQPYSGVKTSILLFDKQIAKKTDKIIFVKVENDGFDLGAQRRPINKNDLPKSLELLLDYKRNILRGIPLSPFNKGVDEEVKEGISHTYFTKGGIDKATRAFSQEEIEDRGLIGGEFYLPYNSDLKEKAKYLRKNMTESEKKIWYILKDFNKRNNEQGITVLRQKPIDNYIVDFYIPKLKLVIEIDGDSHFTEEGILYDKQRTKILESYGLKVLRFTNEEVAKNIDGVISKIFIIPITKTGIKEDLSHSPFNKRVSCEAAGGLIIEKSKIREIGDYNLSGERYRENCSLMNCIFPMVELSKLVEIKTGKKDVNSGSESGKYPFFTCAKEYTFSDEYSFDTEALLIAGNGDVGSVKYFKGKFEAYQRTYVLTDFKNVLPKYLYVCLDIKLKETVSKLKLGNTMPYIKLGMLQDFKIPLPPLEIQEQIVEELDNYQKIIDGAKQIVENYKPRIKIDPSWEVLEFQKVCILEYGSGLPKEKRIDGVYPVMGSNGICGYHNNFIIEGPAIIVGRKGSAGEVVWEERNCFPIDTTYYIKLVNSKTTNFKFIYYILKSLNLPEIKGGAGIPGLNRNDVYQTYQIPLPPLEIQQQIVSKIEEEQKMVESAKGLIEVFENKIKERIGEVWGEKDLDY